MHPNQAGFGPGYCIEQISKNVKEGVGTPFRIILEHHFTSEIHHNCFNDFAAALDSAGGLALGKMMECDDVLKNSVRLFDS
ncbi:unnamed protein product [Dracunculus medinensis]|uniref:Mannonate dehydratase n=1 Tax=Dracunculus medinensis TaxID=318479 RepID=A0A0N4U0U1_DRAME|nr:unnamed protein product [Dracunculus medinensis]